MVQGWHSSTDIRVFIYEDKCVRLSGNANLARGSLVATATVSWAQNVP